jgi:D-alanyl-D-alanine carboxypeptidase
MAVFLSKVQDGPGSLSWPGMLPGGNQLIGAAGAMPDVSCLMHTRLKSGSMKNVLNYAGYIRRRDGTTISVAAFFADFDCSRDQVRRRFFDFIYRICAGQD